MLSYQWRRDLRNIITEMSRAESEGEAMSETNVIPETAINEDQEKMKFQKEYGCVFCITGQEKKVVQRLEQAIPGLRAISPEKLRYRRTDDTMRIEKAILFPGYVFFEVNDDSDSKIRTIYKDPDVIRLLFEDNEAKDWKLTGQDKVIIKELFYINGVVNIWKVYFDKNGIIHILDGLLKGYDRYVKKINRRAKTMNVVFCIGETTFNIWVGYKEQEQPLLLQN